MLRIEIDIPRPWLALLLVLGGLTCALWYQADPTVRTAMVARVERAAQAALVELQGITDVPAEDPQGGPGTAFQSTTSTTLDDMREERLSVLAREQSLRTLSSVTIEQRQELRSLALRRSRLEEAILSEIHTHWKEEGISFTGTLGSVLLSWPVDASKGITSHFKEPSYRAAFGVDHYGIDIRAEQESIIRSPADGTVLEVADNGLGYSYIVVDHGNGIQSKFGHVSAFLVQEGMHIIRGQAIALTGGMPGTKGAGTMTTGPHLHFEVIVDGVNQDPLGYLDGSVL